VHGYTGLQLVSIAWEGMHEGRYLWGVWVSSTISSLLLQTFWAKETLVKSLLISTLDKVIYYIGTFLLGSTKPLFTTHNRVEIS
jgi:hypothetical protein